jgi:hypothetical protein
VVETTLLYTFGPTLTLVCPWILTAAAFLSGWLVHGSARVVLALAILLALSALMSPTDISHYGTSGWPSPWFFSLYFGPAKLEVSAFFLLLGCVLFAFILGSALRLALLRRKSQTQGDHRSPLS